MSFFTPTKNAGKQSIYIERNFYLHFTLRKKHLSRWPQKMHFGIYIYTYTTICTVFIYFGSILCPYNVHNSTKINKHISFFISYIFNYPKMCKNVAWCNSRCHYWITFKISIKKKKCRLTYILMRWYIWNEHIYKLCIYYIGISGNYKYKISNNWLNTIRLKL